jgi:hypothetical protein
MGDQGTQDTDMGEAPRRAAAERQPNDRASDGSKAHLLGVVCFVPSAPDPNVLH